MWCRQHTEKAEDVSQVRAMRISWRSWWRSCPAGRPLLPPSSESSRASAGCRTLTSRTVCIRERLTRSALTPETGHAELSACSHWSGALCRGLAPWESESDTSAEQTSSASTHAIRDRLTWGVQRWGGYCVSPVQRPRHHASEDLCWQLHPEQLQLAPGAMGLVTALTSIPIEAERHPLTISGKSQCNRVFIIGERAPPADCTLRGSSEMPSPWGASQHHAWLGENFQMYWRHFLPNTHIEAGACPMQARSLWREGQDTSARQLTLQGEALVRCGKPHDSRQVEVILSVIHWSFPMLLGPCALPWEQGLQMTAYEELRPLKSSVFCVPQQASRLRRARSTMCWSTSPAARASGQGAAAAARPTLAHGCSWIAQ